LTDQIERLHISAQTQALNDISRKTRTQITGTCADDDGADISRFKTTFEQRFFCRLSCEGRRVAEKTLCQRVGIDTENVVERVNRKPARFNAIVALQDSAGDEMRTRIQP